MSLEWEGKEPSAAPPAVNLARVSTPRIAMGIRQASDVRARLEADGSLLISQSPSKVSVRKLSALL
eukprot:1142709-Prymnesium_polylepis.2